MKQKDKAPDHDKELKDLRKQIARLEAASAFAGKDCEKDTFSALNYRMIYHQVNDAILVLNLETGTIIDANRKTLEMFGYPPEEITKLTIEDLSAGEPQKVTLSWIMDAARTKPQLFEWIARSREGKRFWVEVNLKRVVTAGNDHILAVVRDITDRKNMEETLRHSEQRYRDLFENANDAIFIVDSGLNYIDVNKKAIEMLGHSKEELLTMNILDVIPEEQIPRSEAEFRKLKETGSYEKFIGKIRTKDGRLIDVEVNSSAIMDGNRIIGSRDIVRDITERKKMEEEIIKAQKLESIGMLAGG
ncbi:MAG: PAS domain S-box protein, partial [Nitrospirae bacterium]|nr:PAS domain S-box protein [Nitrospirota bacterium]